jgi:hypothetical protein
MSFFLWLFDFIGDLFLGAAGINGVPGPSSIKLSDDFPKREDRAPFPAEGPVNIRPPVDDAKTSEKRKAADKEFWSDL